MSGTGVTVDLTTLGTTSWPGGGDDNSGNDSVLGSANNDSVAGGLGNDTLSGGLGSDTLSGGNGTDSLTGGLGNDSLFGGNQFDAVFYTDAAGSVTVNLATGRSFGDGNDSLSSIEFVHGSGFGDSLSASGSTTAELFGAGGNDTITISGANHRAYGDDGDDSLRATDGIAIQGGNGNDTLVAGTGGTTQLFGDQGHDSLVGGAGAFQSHYGRDGNDTLVAGANGAFLYGDFLPGTEDTGDDSLYGSNNVDAMYGSLGNDTLFGGGGADQLEGNEGDDRLEGGDGVDVLTAGVGNDWMDFGDGDENFIREITADVTETGNDTLIGGLGSDTLDLQSNWSFLSESGGFSIYQDNSDTIWARDWEQVVCFAEGTRIVTPNGEDLVENLRAGDMVLAMRDGQAAFEPLRWVGFMDITVPRNAVMAAKTAPILIKAGAIAPGMPARDLRVSPDHAMEVDGHLIPAKHLVNGSSIVQEIWCKRVRYFHLELEAHGLLLSEGTWSESYLDDGNRHAFNNAALTGLFLDFEGGRSKGQYDHLACLPVLRQGLKLDEIHGRIALRAAELARKAKGRRRA
jgi:Ca2+-binding RTX toxin-like protein